MGDVIMSTPALKALKQTFKCRLTLLTSSMGALITPHVSTVDETIIADLPWIKSNQSIASDECIELVNLIKAKQFDAAIIFTVYSQNPLPTAMIAYLAGIPLRLAYCRENPYQLLTHWLPDKEPYQVIQHQVERDLKLVEFVGAQTDNKELDINFSTQAKWRAEKKLRKAGITDVNNAVIIHAGVSEQKRAFPLERWVEALKLIHARTGRQYIFTGSTKETAYVQSIVSRTGPYCVNCAGLLSIEEFIAAISMVPLVVTVNTATAHIAAATQTPVIVLYAQTNPQHTPWKVKSSVLYFPVEQSLQTKNEVIQYVNRKLYHTKINYPSAKEIAEAAESLLSAETNGALFTA